MSQPVIQTSFHAGEWSPSLNARVDLAKYQSAAALLENFFVDYRGGASTRMGTKYILQAYKSATAVRLITFQASFSLGYEMEFGDYYIRFYYNGAPILESSFAITAITKANPGVITAPGHNLIAGDWFYVESVGGMTQVNQRYFRAKVVVGNAISLGKIIDNANVDTSAYGVYTAGGTIKRVYTLPSPYAAADLALLKYAQQSSTKMVFTHASYVPYVLTLIAAANWTIIPIAFGASISAPAPTVATTLAAGTVNYAYVVTAVDVNGQESAPSAVAALANKTDLRTVAGTNTISWAAISGAIRYNVYKSELSYAGAVPSGESFGFIGFTTGVSLIDSNIAPDFSETPPIAKNPFQGAGVASVTQTAAGNYATVPTATLTAAPAGGQTATVSPVLGVTGTAITSSGVGNVVGTVFIPILSLTTGILTGSLGGLQLRVTAVDGAGNVTAVVIDNPGALTSGAIPVNDIRFAPSAGGNTFGATLTWGVKSTPIVSPGSGYLAAPVVTYSAGAAAATAVLGPSSSGNPAVPSFIQQRLVLAGPSASPQQFDFSQPGSYYNFNISNPVQPDDAFEGNLVSGQLNEIKSLVPMPSGLIVLTNRAAWQIYGASAGGPISAVENTAQSQSFSGANDVYPIVANFDILYVQAKGSSVRDLTYNFYTNIYTGTDISVLSSHLFFGYTIIGWAWAEEPFKIVWAIRSDGVALSLTFLKEQELIGWTHHITDGLFKSVATVTEQIAEGFVDAVYWVVERTIAGNTVKYIERMADRFLTTYILPWCVDAGLQYNGVPATSFTGAEHLATKTIVGLADGIPFTKVVTVAGGFTLDTAASFVTAGLQFTPRLQTLAIDLGNPTAQGKMKKISQVTVRCEKTLGLRMGSTESDLVVMKDLVLGNVGSDTNAVVTDLVTGDAQTIIDPKWQEPGQYFITQPLPYPASILGVIPEITVGDTK